MHIYNFRKSICCFITTLTLMLILVGCNPTPSPTLTPLPTHPPKPVTQRFDGLKINLLTFDGPQIDEPLKRRAPEFEQLTGAQVNVTVVPFSELYQTMLKDMSSKTNHFQFFVIPPQWTTDFVIAGYLENLTARVKADPTLDWEDIAPFFRDFSATYRGQIYTIPLDGDFQMVYYRTDTLEQAKLQPPDTWDDYLNIAQTLHGKDFNGDGQADYGSCISEKPKSQSYWMIWSLVSAYLQSQGTRQGAFFDTETLEPLVKNEAFAAALELYKKTTAYGPPDELTLGVAETRQLFAAGRCALSVDWGDIGTLAIAPDSKVVDKVGAIILPGSSKVLDRKTGKLVLCDKISCPYAINGINHAPYAASGGWSGVINGATESKIKEAAYAYLVYMGQPAQANVDVTIGATGFNPYRLSQFKDRSLWLKAGMSQTAADRYLGAIDVSLSSPNMVLDLRVPQNQRYQQIVLDDTIAKYLADEITTEQAMQQIYEGWNQITTELGHQSQLDAYRASLGIVQ